MNAQEIDAMKAGRKLDILIAERIFGYGVDLEFDEPVVKELRDKHDDWGILPNFSTDISDAFLVSQRLAERMFIDDTLDPEAEKGINALTLIQCGVADWCAAFMCETDLPEDWIDNANSLPFASNAPTPALSICRAALKAVLLK